MGRSIGNGQCRISWWSGGSASALHGSSSVIASLGESEEWAEYSSEVGGDQIRVGKVG